MLLTLPIVGTAFQPRQPPPQASSPSGFLCFAFRLSRLSSIGRPGGTTPTRSRASRFTSFAVLNFFFFPRVAIRAGYLWKSEPTTANRSGITQAGVIAINAFDRLAPVMNEYANTSTTRYQMVKMEK